MPSLLLAHYAIKRTNEQSNIKKNEAKKQHVIYGCLRPKSEKSRGHVSSWGVSFFSIITLYKRNSVFVWCHRTHSIWNRRPNMFTLHLIFNEIKMTFRFRFAVGLRSSSICPKCNIKLNENTMLPFEWRSMCWIAIENEQIFALVAVWLRVDHIKGVRRAGPMVEAGGTQYTNNLLVVLIFSPTSSQATLTNDKFIFLKQIIMVIGYTTFNLVDANFNYRLKLYWIYMRILVVVRARQAE